MLEGKAGVGAGSVVNVSLQPPCDGNIREDFKTKTVKKFKKHINEGGGGLS